jgi:hypothetical protein
MVGPAGQRNQPTRPTFAGRLAEVCPFLSLREGHGSDNGCPRAQGAVGREEAMATNGLLIEFGSTSPMSPETRQSIQGIVEMLNTLKKDGSVAEFRLYPIVTGNRSERVALLMLEMSHEQLEALVQKKAYADLINAIMAMGTNVTVNRAITFERMLELSQRVM